jgi:5-methylcytosine-specific restriction endonuclease McrA
MGLPKRQKRRRTRRKRRPHIASDPGYYTKAGPVTITRADGSTEVRPALDPIEYQRVVRVRRAITPELRVRIIRRDKKCRYCQTTVGPWEIDHKVPISLGGSNRLSNLVLSCAECNRRKGASLW